jgi:gluconate kinase
MGIRNYLIEGVSGAGKTTVAEELQRRGYHVIHGDRNFAYYGDPETGAPLHSPAMESEAERIAWSYARWIWPVERVRSILADQSEPVSFFCGGSRNSHHYIDLFDGVFVLEIDPETLIRRLAGRSDEEFGGRLLERELVMRMNVAREGVPKTATTIDATRPIVQIVDEILSICGKAD